MDLGLADDERRAEGQAVTGQGTSDHAVAFQYLDQPQADLHHGVVIGAGILVGDKFEGADQADAADFSDELMAGETTAQFRLQHGANGLHVLTDLDLVVDLQRLDDNGGGDGVAGISEAGA